MARGRMINQTIDYDPEFNALSIEAQLMYMRALAFLDRDGLIMGHPRGLLSKVAPLMESMQPLMPGIINEWVDQGLVIRYTVKIGDILFFKGFGKNQSGMHYDRESPSRFDPPPGWTYGPKGLVKIESAPTPPLHDTDVPTESSETPTQPDDSAQTESGTTPAELRQESGESPTQIEVKDQVKDQDQETTAPPLAPAAAKPKDHLAVLAYRELHERYPTKAQMKIIAERDPPIGDWVRAIRQWASNGYNPRNIDRMLEWAFNPSLITERIYPNGAKHGTNPQGNQPNDEPEYDPERQRKFDEFRAKRKADGSLYYR